MGDLQTHQRRRRRAKAPSSVPGKYKPPVCCCSLLNGAQLYLVSAKLCLCSSVSFLFIYGFVELRPTQPEFAVTMLLVPGVVLKPVLAVYFIKREVAVGTAAIVVSSGLHSGLTAHG